jgi:hypothetical protein
MESLSGRDIVIADGLSRTTHTGIARAAYSLPDLAEVGPSHMPEPAGAAGADKGDSR